MQCVIKCNDIKIDVVELYKKAGFQFLPRRLTIDGFRLRVLGKVPTNYLLQDKDGNEIPPLLAIAIDDGDEFFSAPPANFSPPRM